MSDSTSPPAAAGKSPEDTFVEIHGDAWRKARVFAERARAVLINLERQPKSWDDWERADYLIRCCSVSLVQTLVAIRIAKRLLYSEHYAEQVTDEDGPITADIPNVIVQDVTEGGAA